MRRRAKITTEARLDSVINAIPEADRTARIRAALVGLNLGTMHITAMVPCPVCGQNTLPAEYRHGIRQCRNCTYYNQQNFSAEQDAEVIADSRHWAISHGKAVA